MLDAVRLPPRVRLCVDLLYCAGLREGEALGLRIEDLCVSRDVAPALGCAMPGGAHLHVRRRLNRNGVLAKSRIDRVVPMSPPLLQSLRDWHAWCFETFRVGLDLSALLLSLAGPTAGQAWSVSGFATMWASKVKAVPALSGVNPHMLRHTFASELADAGVDALASQQLLGHESAESTSIYTHSLMGTLRAAVARLADWRQQPGIAT